MIVRGTATAANESHQVLLALPHRAHARSSDVERSGATNEGASAECSRLGQRRNASVHGSRCHRIPERRSWHRMRAAEATAPTAAETKGSSKSGDREGRRAHVQHVSRTVPLTVKLSGRAEAPDWSRGRTLSFRAHGDTDELHGPLQRWLGAGPDRKAIRLHRRRLRSISRGVDPIEEAIRLELYY